MSEVFNYAVYVGTGSRINAKEFTSKVAAKHYIFVIAEERFHADWQHERGQLVQELITLEGGEQRYYSYNLSEFNGVKKATGLKDIFPNVKLKEETSKPSKTLAELVEQLKNGGLGKNGNVQYLLLDLPGAGSEILAKAAIEDLSVFTQIEYVNTDSSYFEGGSAQFQAIEAKFKGSYFKKSEALLETNDVDFPVVAFQRDIRAEKDSRIERLEAEVKRLKQALTESQQLAQATKEQLDELTQQFEAVKAEKQKHLECAHHLKKELDELNPALEAGKQKAAEQAQKLAESEAQIAKIQQQLNERSEQLKTNKLKLADTQEKLKSAETERQKLTDWVNSLKNQLDDQRSKYEEAKDNLSKLQAQSEQQQAQLQKYEKEIESAREDARNALRLVTIRDGDLKDLQEKYAKSLDIQERQFKLLDTMQDRLEQASNYLLELDGDSVTAELLLADDHGAEQDEEIITEAVTEKRSSPSKKTSARKASDAKSSKKPSTKKRGSARRGK
ncbi:MAG: hypothetical protein HLUCCO02_07835 [Idiomarinaceae bacterium HL-53]|nr:MAG: hypothetical protein HLUCCO02_07835 [Idiomarinaceae bacterium HL-53]CUS47119.1 hypothetical protein Ga0003345_0045 [Idiomarinaceae bacterium HL-53]